MFHLSTFVNGRGIIESSWRLCVHSDVSVRLSVVVCVSKARNYMVRLAKPTSFKSPGVRHVQLSALGGLTHITKHEMVWQLQWMCWRKHFTFTCYQLVLCHPHMVCPRNPESNSKCGKKCATFDFFSIHGNRKCTCVCVWCSQGVHAAPASVTPSMLENAAVGSSTQVSDVLRRILGILCCLTCDNTHGAWPIIHIDCLRCILHDHNTIWGLVGASVCAH